MRFQRRACAPSAPGGLPFDGIVRAAAAGTPCASAVMGGAGGCAISLRRLSLEERELAETPPPHLSCRDPEPFSATPAIASNAGSPPSLPRLSRGRCFEQGGSPMLKDDSAVSRADGRSAASDPVSSDGRDVHFPLMLRTPEIIPRASVSGSHWRRLEQARLCPVRLRQTWVRLLLSRLEPGTMFRTRRKSDAGK